MDEHDLDDDPIAQLQAWLAEARDSVPQPDAMTLATADEEGRPSARVVLLRGIDERGLAFFTNLTSRKAHALRQNPRAAVVLHWWELGRQVRVEGAIVEVSDEDSNAYWKRRPRASQIAGWASPQSQSLADRSDLDARVAEVEERFDGGEVLLPPFWAAIASFPTASSSGRTRTAGFTTAFSTPVRARAGGATGSLPDLAQSGICSRRSRSREHP